MVWTAKDIEKLREYALLDLSCAEIAAKMPGKTRNGVIGKMHRLKITRIMARKRMGRERTKQKPVISGSYTPPPLKTFVEEAKKGVMVNGRQYKLVTKNGENLLTPEPSTPTKPSRGAFNNTGLAHLPAPLPSESIDESMFKRSTGGVSLLDATHSHCRWPLEGHAKDGMPRCCGDSTVRGSYCADHYMRVHSKTAGGAKPLVAIE